MPCPAWPKVDELQDVPYGPHIGKAFHVSALHRSESTGTVPVPSLRLGATWQSVKLS